MIVLLSKYIEIAVVISMVFTTVAGKCSRYPTIATTELPQSRSCPLRASSLIALHGEVPAHVLKRST